MRLAMLVTPESDRNLQLAAQVGVTDIVAIYPGLELKPLLELKSRVESFGMRLTHVERKIPHLKFVHNLPGRDEQIEDFKTLIRNMAEAEMEVLCYNWMPDEDWQRTTGAAPERAGAKVTAFDIDQINSNVTDATPAEHDPTPADALWDHLKYFLEQVLPTAEDANIRLAIHPDDPPLPVLRGQPRIIINHDAMQKVVDLVPSPMNGVCYCQGSFAPAGLDPVEGIKQLGPHIFFAHFRNTVGQGERFRESFHDNGDIDMVAAMQAYHDIGYTGAIRPDHAPSLAGETNETPGYEIMGRLYAAGYMKGLMQAAAGYRNA
ncbi:mannonate dehydratase [Aeoliella sp.]|uniref:mannonate dehydratase n=1 Tax=Aeoliella sp. TaxID=2795800 RepID=UPI003CCBA78A